MTPYNAPALFQQLKRAQAERAVRHGFDDSNLYNAKLLQLDNIEIEKFNKLKGIIGSSKAQKKSNEIDLNSQGLKSGEIRAKFVKKFPNSKFVKPNLRGEFFYKIEFKNSIKNHHFGD